MNNFKIIYKILKAIELSMDYDEFDANSISPEFLEVSQNRWENFIIELVENGYVTGIFLVPIMGRSQGVKIII